MNRLITPSKRALESARKLARYAAKNDNWMTPCPEEHRKETDVGNISQSHRDGWEETCHWDHYYRRPLQELTDQQILRFTKHPEEISWDDRYYGIYCELVDAFWEEWETKTDFYRLARECLESKVR